MVNLSKLVIPNAEYIRDSPQGPYVFHVRDPHALTRAAGYIKYISAKRNGEGIFFRGQTKLYGSLVPRLFRGISKLKAQENRVARLRRVIRRYKAELPIFRDIHEAIYEPLLQHYGLSTTWIDIVDNMWVALWFGCFHARSPQHDDRYLHYERRIPKSHKQQFAYILLVGAELNWLTEAPVGLASGSNTELVDLRMASPSIFLRPHAQHALVFRQRGTNQGRPLDYSDQVRGIIRISLDDALAWLGQSMTLSVHALFPPPYYDFGYRFLLGGEFPEVENVGKVTNVGSLYDSKT